MIALRPRAAIVPDAVLLVADIRPHHRQLGGIRLLSSHLLRFNRRPGAIPDGHQSI